MKTLVVFYSLTGTTRNLAFAIAEALKCDVEEIIETKRRKGIPGFLRACYEARLKKPVPIKDTTFCPELYDLVIIGTPVWAGTISSPARTYIQNNKERFKNIAFFCTAKSSGINGALAEMERTSGKKAIAQIGIRTRDIKSGEYINKLKDFLARISKPDETA